MERRADATPAELAGEARDRLYEAMGALKRTHGLVEEAYRLYGQAGNEYAEDMAQAAIWMMDLAKVRKGIEGTR